MAIDTNVTVCIPTLNRYDLLQECIKSLHSGVAKPKEIVVMNNGKEYVENKDDVKVISFGRNIGVASSWNWFMKNVQFPMLICNDDLEFGPNDILKFQNAYDAGFEFLYTDNISHLNMFSCFMPTLTCVEEVGYFDEEFYPAYFEDNDYFYRMKLASINFGRVVTELKHVGSATLQNFSADAMSLHHDNFRKNKKYYINKWGGEPHQEQYVRPFNE